MNHPTRARNLACLLLLTWAAAALDAAPDAVSDSPQAASAELPLPDAQQIATVLAGLPAQVEGCGLLAAPLTLDSQALADYLGPSADDLLAYDHTWTVAAEYALTTGKQTVTVDVHRMATDLEAFGPFSRRRTEAAQVAPALPTLAYWLGSQLHVWRGPFYIHTRAASDDTALRLPIQQLTEATSAAIPIPARYPAMLRLLPARARQVSSAQYYRGQVPGFAVLADTVTVAYVESFKATCRLLLARCPDTATASAAYAEMLSQLAADDRNIEPLAEIANRAALIQSADGRMAALMQQDNFIAVVLDSRQRQFAEALLRMTATNVRVYLLVEQ